MKLWIYFFYLNLYDFEYSMREWSRKAVVNANWHLRRVTNLNPTFIKKVVEYIQFYKFTRLIVRIFF